MLGNLIGVSEGLKCRRTWSWVRKGVNLYFAESFVVGAALWGSKEALVGNSAMGKKKKSWGEKYVGILVAES